MKIRKTKFNSLFEALSASVQLKKMTDWHNGNRRENVAAMGNEKLLFNYNICVQAGFTKEANILAGFIKNRGLSIPGSASTSTSTPVPVTASASTPVPAPASTSVPAPAHNGNSGKYRVISTSQPGQYVGEIGVSKKGSIYKWTGKSWSAVGRKQSNSTTHTSASAPTAPSVSSTPSTQSTSSTYRQISTSKHNGAYDDPGQYVGEIGQTRRGSLYKWSGKSWAPYKDPANNSNTETVSGSQTAPNEPISQAKPASEPIQKSNPEPEPEEPFNPIILNDIKSIDELKKQLGITGKMNLAGKYDTASKKYIFDNNSIYHFIDKFIKDNRIGFLFTRNIDLYSNHIRSYRLKTHNGDEFFIIYLFFYYPNIVIKHFQCYIYDNNTNDAAFLRPIYGVNTYDDKFKDITIKVDPSDSESISKYIDLEKLLYHTCNIIIKYAKAKQLSNPDYFDLEAKLERKSSQIVPLNRDFGGKNILVVGTSKSTYTDKHNYSNTCGTVTKDSGHEIYCTKKFNIPLCYQDYLSGEFKIIYKIVKIDTKPLLDRLLNADDIIKNTFTILSLIKDNADNLSFIPNISFLMRGDYPSDDYFNENFANFMYIITPNQAFNSNYYDLAYNIAIFMHIDHINKNRRNLYYYVPLQNKIIKCEVSGRANTSNIVAVEDADFDNPGKIFKEALGMSRNINTLVKL
jgi:hypothetical protein